MQNVRQFTFDTSFDEHEAGPARQKRRKSHYTAEEVDAIRKQAFAEGADSAQAQAAEMCARALAETAQHMGALLHQLDATAHQHRTQAMELALLSARKIARTALDHYAQQDIASLIDECLARLPTEAGIRITLNTQLKEALEPHLAQMAKDSGFTGRLMIAGSDQIPTCDCAVQWSNGGVELKREAIEREIEQTVRQRLDSEAHAMQGDLFDTLRPENRASADGKTPDPSPDFTTDDPSHHASVQ